MQVKIYGEIYECDKAVKGADFVKLIKGGVSIAEFSGISNFDGYKIIEGEWSEPEKTTEQLLMEQVVSLTVEISKMKMGVN